ncbi:MULTISPECIES: IS91 family transposase [Rhodopirellula]|uniref:IS91 family transposase n=1 Tax=Rhodopirellula TaxID=265488 RepID=UPI0026C34E96
MPLDLQQLMRKHFPRLAKSRALSGDMHRAAWCITHCRTREMGGHVNSCPQGHYHQVAYNSCSHRCCPKCAWLAREKWLDGWKARLLPVPHHHLIFTIPHSLNPIWRFNKRAFADVFFQAASQSLMQLLGSAQYMGARPGILAALHTWNQKLDEHVHLHVLVTAGGLSEDGTWIGAKKKCLLPRKVLMTKFRGKFKTLLKEAFRNGKIKLPPGWTINQLYALLYRLSGAWNVKVFDAYEGGASVVTYLARYLRGGPIGNSRLLQERDGRVVFRYRLSELEGGDGKRQGVTSLPTDTFLMRWLEHVPPRRYQCVRGFGLYSGNQHSDLVQAHQVLGSGYDGSVQEAKTWQELCDAAGMDEACRCPACGSLLVSHHSFQPGRSPPSSAFVTRNLGQIA